MKRLGYRLLTLAALVWALTPAPARAQNPETYKETAAEREACTSDVWRLCKRYIPSRTAIAGCLERSSDLSPACAAVMRGPSAAASPPRTRDPRE